MRLQRQADISMFPADDPVERFESHTLQSALEDAPDSDKYVFSGHFLHFICPPKS